MSYASSVLALSPQLYWRLGEAAASPTVADSSGNAHTGTVSSGVTLGIAGALTGDANTAASFDNTANAKIVATGYKPYANATQRTITGIHWRNATTDADTLVSDASASAINAILRLQSGSQDVVWMPDQNSGGTFATWTAGWPSTGAWVNWAITLDMPNTVFPNNGTAELFINGASIGARTGFTQIYGASNDFQIGNSKSVGSEPFNGKADEIAVFNGLLTAGQIAGLYTAATTASGSVSRSLLGIGS